MKTKVNINNDVHIQITTKGWEYLNSIKGPGKGYIDNCIEARKSVINGEIWYRMQLWECFSLFPVEMGDSILFNTNILFENKDLADYYESTYDFVKKASIVYLNGKTIKDRHNEPQIPNFDNYSGCNVLFWDPTNKILSLTSENV